MVPVKLVPSSLRLQKTKNLAWFQSAWKTLTVKQQLQKTENVMKILNAQAIPKFITLQERSNVLRLIAQMQQTPQTGLVWMASATKQVNAQITLKNRSMIQRDVPKRHATPDKSSKLMVHALTVPIIKRPMLMVNHV